MSTSVTPARRRLALVGAVLAFAAISAACGSDDAAPELPEGGTGSAFNDVIITSESHDEVLLDGGEAEMLVAVDCDPQTGGNVVTVVAEGLEPAVYIGEFEPAAGGDLSLDATQGGQAVGARQTTLDAAEYTITFADIEGAVFTVMGCPS